MTKPLYPAPRAPTQSPAVSRFLAKARRAWQQRQTDAAKRAIFNALALAPENPEAVRMLGMVTQRQGCHAKAIECFQRVLATWPEDHSLRIGLGLSLFEHGEFAEATVQLRQACKLAPGSASAWFNLGEALWRQDYPREALPPLERALALDPAHAAARLSLARAHASLGQAATAAVGFREVLHHAPACADAWYGLSLGPDPFNAEDTARLQQTFARNDLPARDHELIGFSLAKALESRGDYTQAFEVLERANASQRARTAWDSAYEHARVESIMRAFDDRLPAPCDPHLGDEAIFIASMPRSGSTLVEQILASHPDVEGANEIKILRQVIETESRSRNAPFPAWVASAAARDWQRLGSEYLAETARWRQAKPRFTDKNLMNWPLVGAALAMLPAARIIVVQRNPLETCLGCFRQCFTKDAGFACDLDATADYYADFLRLSRFWISKFPNRAFDLRYEDLVANPEVAVRDLLTFCDLPFDSACLEFHKTSRAVLTPSAAQVRQPLRSDTARSGHYGCKLDPLRDRLRNAGVPLG